MNNQPIDPRALKAAEEIDRECLEFVTWSRHEEEKPKEKIARIIQSHFAESVKELSELKEANAQLKDIVVKGNRDWHRLKDFIIACNGPAEMIRFQEAARKNNNKGVEMFLSYITSLWNELAQSQPPSMADELAEALDYFVNQAARPEYRIEARELLARYSAQKGLS